MCVNYSADTAQREYYYVKKYSHKSHWNVLTTIFTFSEGTQFQLFK